MILIFFKYDDILKIKGYKMGEKRKKSTFF